VVSLAATVTGPLGLRGFTGTLAAGGTLNAFVALYLRPSGETNSVPFWNSCPLSGLSFFTRMAPAANFTAGGSSSKRWVPPATSSLPSGRNACPEQNMSAGVGTSLVCPVSGS